MLLSSSGFILHSLYGRWEEHKFAALVEWYLSAWKTSHNSSMRQSQSGLGTQTANQPKLIRPILSPGQPRPKSLAQSVKALSLTSKSLALAYSPVGV